MFRYELINSTRKFTIVAEIVSLLKEIYKRDAPFRAMFKAKTLAVLFSPYPREMKHMPRNLTLPPFWRLLVSTPASPTPASPTPLRPKISKFSYFELRTVYFCLFYFSKFNFTYFLYIYHNCSVSRDVPECCGTFHVPAFNDRPSRDHKFA